VDYFCIDCDEEEMNHMQDVNNCDSTSESYSFLHVCHKLISIGRNHIRTIS